MLPERYGGARRAASSRMKRPSGQAARHLWHSYRVEHRRRRRVLLPRLRGRPQLPPPHRPSALHRARHPAAARADCAGPSSSAPPATRHFGTGRPRPSHHGPLLRDAARRRPHGRARRPRGRAAPASRTVRETAVGTVRAAGFDDCTEDQLTRPGRGAGRRHRPVRRGAGPVRRGARHRAARGAGAADPPSGPGGPRVDPAAGRPHRPRRRALQPGGARGAQHRRRRAAAAARTTRRDCCWRRRARRPEPPGGVGHALLGRVWRRAHRPETAASSVPP